MELFSTKLGYSLRIFVGTLQEATANKWKVVWDESYILLDPKHCLSVLLLRELCLCISSRWSSLEESYWQDTSITYKIVQTEHILMSPPWYQSAFIFNGWSNMTFKCYMRKLGMKKWTDRSLIQYPENRQWSSDVIRQDLGYDSSDTCHILNQSLVEQPHPQLLLGKMISHDVPKGTIPA
jgi:hypothetical protein